MTSITDQQIEEWRDAVGRCQTWSQYLDSASAQRYSVASGLTPDVTSALAHWAWFLEAAPDTAIGPDGHLKRGTFLPDISLPRRMFAASSIEFYKPLKLDNRAEVKIEISDLFHKAGSQGDLVFAIVERTIIQAGEISVKEVQTLVYRGGAASIPLPAEKDLVNEAGDEIWTPNTVNLFRFSAVTFNSHRIHFDQPYARDVEGYPELVVHGPFTATKLADLAAKRGSLVSFRFRGMAPLFQGQPVLLRQISDSKLQALRCDGVVAVEAMVEYR